ADASYPTFDPNGKFLYFLVSTDAGPVQDWFSQANADMAASRAIYLAVLAKGVPSPLAKQSDEEGAKKEGDDKPKDEKKDGNNKDAKPPVVVTIDQDGLSQRIVALPLKPAGYSDLQVGVSGQIFYRKEPGAVRNGDTSLNRYDLEKRKEDTLAEAVQNFDLSPNGKMILVRLKDSWSISEVGEKIDLAKYKLNLDRV